jgi:hypothetical protein
LPLEHGLFNFSQAPDLTPHLNICVTVGLEDRLGHITQEVVVAITMRHVLLHEMTLGLNIRPDPWLWVRPKARYDWAQFTHPYTTEPGTADSRSASMSLCFSEPAGDRQVESSGQTEGVKLAEIGTTPPAGKTAIFYRIVQVTPSRCSM